ncbi:MAG: DUF4432 family protein [Opitutaceae bacterium]|nr:DUF4432 family protein [Opitutaceae bacterium]
MKKTKSRKSGTQASGRSSSRQPRATGKAIKPVLRVTKDQGRRCLSLENQHCQIVLCPDQGGAIVSYVHRPSGIDVLWRNPYGQPPRSRVLDQPMGGGSDLFDVMDGSWYVSLPTGFFPGDYFGAPIGTHGELRSLPWTVERTDRARTHVEVTLLGWSVRTPLGYRRTLRLEAGSPRLIWTETVINRAARALPVAWLQHPAFSGPLIDGAQLVTSARTVRVFKADDPSQLQLVSGFEGPWPHVPERETGKLRDCSRVPAADSGHDHSVQLTDFATGRGCFWNAELKLGFVMEWDAQQFPYAWSWARGGGPCCYPLWGAGQLVTLQPSTSPVGRFPDLVRAGAVLTVPAGGEVSTTLHTGFVSQPEGPWA